ncbi:hypothetical protein AB0R12_34955, partial [Streptomyces niveus]|uniref:hypothetical protein n=1 Tax=Streptomyces niveus TaxID=193462 RepID=UPI00342C737A
WRNVAVRDHLAAATGLPVHERDNPVVLMDNARSHMAPRDPAEDTSIVRQPGLLRLADIAYLSTSDIAVSEEGTSRHAQLASAG